MPGPLKYYKRDPMYPVKKRGEGYYYLRSDGYWSKHSRAKDLQRGGKIGSGPYKHTHDRLERKRSGRAVEVKRHERITKGGKKVMVKKHTRSAPKR